jgi:hypothetical protein
LISFVEDKTVTLTESEIKNNILQKNLKRQRRVGRILNSKIRNLIQENGSLMLVMRQQCNQEERIRRRSGKYPIMEDALVEWIRSEAVNGVDVTPQEMRRKALDIAQDLGIIGFIASPGWLRRFRKRLAQRLIYRW